MSDPFSVLGVTPSFALDLGFVEKRHRELSRALHPDRHASEPPAQRREALGRAIEVNEAFRTLRDPARRAEALLHRLGIAIGEGREPNASAALLMDVMEQREALSDAKRDRDVAAVARLAEAVQRREAGVAARLAALFEAALVPSAVADTEALLASLGELRYLRRFLDEVGAIEDEIGA